MLLSDLSFVSLPSGRASDLKERSSKCMNYLRCDLIFFGHCNRFRHDISREDCLLEFLSSTFYIFLMYLHYGQLEGAETILIVDFLLLMLLKFLDLCFMLEGITPPLTNES